MAKNFHSLEERVAKFDPAEISRRFVSSKLSQKKAFLNATAKFGKKDFSSVDRFPVGHLTVSILIIDELNQSVLVNIHKVGKSLTWFEDHADGNYDLEDQIITEVGKKCGLSPNDFEIWEESGKFVTAREFLKNPDLNAKIMDVSTFPIYHHYKHGKSIADHIHYNVAFVGRTLMENDVKVNPDEKEFVGWKNMQELQIQMKDKRKLEIFEDIMEYISRVI